MASPLPEPFELVDILGDGEIMTCLARVRGDQVLVHVLPADPAASDRVIQRINRLPRNPDFLDRIDHSGHSLIVTRHRPEMEDFEGWLDEHSPEDPEAGTEPPARAGPGEMTQLVLSIKKAVAEEEVEEETEDGGGEAQTGGDPERTRRDVRPEGGAVKGDRESASGEPTLPRQRRPTEEEASTLEPRPAPPSPAAAGRSEGRDQGENRGTRLFLSMEPPGGYAAREDEAGPDTVEAPPPEPAPPAPVTQRGAGGPAGPAEAAARGGPAAGAAEALRGRQTLRPQPTDLSDRAGGVDLVRVGGALLVAGAIVALLVYVLMG